MDAVIPSPVRSAAGHKIHHAVDEKEYSDHFHGRGSGRERVRHDDDAEDQHQDGVNKVHIAVSEAVADVEDVTHRTDDEAQTDDEHDHADGFTGSCQKQDAENNQNDAADEALVLTFLKIPPTMASVLRLPPGQMRRMMPAIIIRMDEESLNFFIHIPR